MNPFAVDSEEYALYRPTYPTELIELFVSLSPNLHSAWDVACGNGQLTYELAEYFEEVIGTDIAKEQIENARQKENITYKIESSSKSSLPHKSVDVITVAQAIHWFEFDAFYAEVNRVAKPNAIIALIGYELVSISPEINKCINSLYTQTLDGYWDDRRKYIDEQYLTIPFPYEELKIPQYLCRLEWKRDDLVGYLSTWSAVKNYKQATSVDPMIEFQDQLNSLWDEKTIMEVAIPILTKIARIK